MLPNGNIVSGSFDGTICIWDITTGKELKLKKLVKHEIYPLPLLMLPNGNIVSRSKDYSSIYILDGETGEKLEKLELADGPSSKVNFLLVLLSGNIFSVSYDGTIRIWEINYGVADLEQSFKKMSAKQAKKVWELLKKLNDEIIGLENLDNEQVIKAEAREKIIKVLNEE